MNVRMLRMSVKKPSADANFTRMMNRLTAVMEIISVSSDMTRIRNLTNDIVTYQAQP